MKVYNQLNNLRIETTINQPYMFKVYRRAQGQPQDARKKLRPLRKGVADIPLRAQVSQEINNRLMDELSTFTGKTPLRELLAPHVRRHTKDGRHVRALDISGKDSELLQAIGDSSFTVSGINKAGFRPQPRGRRTDVRSQGPVIRNRRRNRQSVFRADLRPLSSDHLA